MPLIIVLALMIISVIVFVIALEEKKYWWGKGSALVFVLLIVWLIVAGTRPDREIGRTDFKVHQSPEGYQYITIDGNPYNITKHFGRVIQDGSIVQAVVYEDVYWGIDYPDRNVSSCLEIVDKEF
jgi:hypothetical protein